MSIKYRLISLCLIIGLVISTSSCSEKEITDEEYIYFGRQIELALKENKDSFIINRFYTSAIYDSTIHSLEYNEVNTDQFIKARRVHHITVRDQFKAMLSEWKSSISDPSRFKFIGLVPSNTNNDLLFGYYSPERTDFVIVKTFNNGGKPSIIDVRFVFNGLSLLDNLVWNEVNRRYYGMYGGAYVESQEELRNVNAYINRGNLEKAMMAFNRIPEEFAYSPIFHQAKLRLASQVSDSMFAVALYEKIGILYDDLPARYLNGVHIYNLFAEADTSNMYLDSLANTLGENFVIDSLRLYN